MAKNLLSRDTSTNRNKQTAVDADYIRSNVVSVGTDATSIAVIYSTPVTDANYTVLAGFRNLTDASVAYIPVTVTAQDASGFTAEWNGGIDDNNYELVYQTMGLI